MISALLQFSAKLRLSLLALLLLGTSAWAQSPMPVFTPQAPPTQVEEKTTSELVVEEMLRLTNEARRNRGLRPLRLNDRLSLAAASHSREMLELGYFSHTSPTPGRRKVGDRVRSTGLRPRTVAENIFEAWGDDHSGIARQAFRAWMNSSGHRRNILARKSRSTGIGVYVKGDTISVTQVFASGL